MPSTTTTPLAFAKRAKRDDTDCAHRRIWTDATGHYRVVESRNQFSRNAKGRPRVTFYAMENSPTTGWWDIIQTTRTRQAAEAACQRHANGDPAR